MNHWDQVREATDFGPEKEHKNTYLLYSRYCLYVNSYKHRQNESCLHLQVFTKIKQNTNRTVGRNVQNSALKLICSKCTSICSSQRTAILLSLQLTKGSHLVVIAVHKGQPSCCRCSSQRAAILLSLRTK